MAGAGGALDGPYPHPHGHPQSQAGPENEGEGEPLRHENEGEANLEGDEHLSPHALPPSFPGGRVDAVGEGGFHSSHLPSISNGHVKAEAGVGAGGGKQGKAHTAVPIDRLATLSGLTKRSLRDTITVKFEEVVYRVELEGAQGSWWPSLPLHAPFRKSKPKASDPDSAAEAGVGAGSWNPVAWCSGHAWEEKKKRKEKQVLNGVSGCVMPGEVLAIMGPSGSGKTSFLNIVGGRVKMHHVSGSLTYNDQPYSKALKRRLGFVTQDDLFYPHLTVRETLMYAAILRLPSDLSRKQKIARADETIQELGLHKCKDTIIGGQFMRGISGGERKRVSIGHEILINPSMLLLDEPTSGLDSTTALRIIQVLQNLARSGRTVVTTIHQPSSRLYHSFDKLLLLSEGNSVFFGKAADAMDYFARLGFIPEFATNPADFILDLANGTTAGISLPQELEGKEGWDSMALQERQAEVKKFLADRQREEQLPRVVEDLHALPVASEEEKKAISTRRAWTAPWFLQFSVLWTRGLKERRHELLSPLRFSQVIALGLICGLLWFNSQRTTAYAIQDQVGFVFFLSVFWGFFPLFSAIFTFPQERSMLAKERASDMYRLSSYFISRTLSDTPMELLLPTIFLCISYFMANLPHTAYAFFCTLLGVYLIVVTAQGAGFLLGAAVLDVKKATVLASVILLTFMLAGGYYLQSIPVFINWVKYVSFTWYSYRLLIKVQYQPSETYACGAALELRCPMQDAPALRGVPLQDAWIDALALLAQVVLFWVLAYIALRRMKVGQ